MASVIGKIRSDGQYIVHYNNEIIVDAKADQVTKGFLYERPFSSSGKTIKSTKPQVLNNYNADLISLLSLENFAWPLTLTRRAMRTVRNRYPV